MDTPTLAETMAAALDARADQIRTAMPGEIVTVNATTVDVRPTVWPGGEAAPIIPSVPIEWMRVGTAYLVLPLAVGDTGMLTVCEADIAEWRRTGESGQPADVARHHLQSAVFRPGLGVASSDIGIPIGFAALVAADLRLGDAGAVRAVVHDALLPPLTNFLGALVTWGTTNHANWAAASANFLANVAPRITTLITGIAMGSYKSSTVKVEA